MQEIVAQRFMNNIQKFVRWIFKAKADWIEYLRKISKRKESALKKIVIPSYHSYKSQLALVHNYIIMLFFLKKVAHIKFGFTNLHRFNAGEQIFKTIYTHNDHIQEDFDKKSPQQIASMLNQNQKPRSLLSDKIKQNLHLMKVEGKISSEVANEILDLFQPHIGINMSEIPFIQHQEDRWKSGANQSKRFPLNPNSSVMKYILKQLFSYGTQESRGILNPTFYMSGSKSFITHIKGTPGFGKSSCLLTAKFILDLRIKHLIQADSPPTSIFGEKQNYKLFYFDANSDINQIEQEILKNLSNDFGPHSKEVQSVKNKPIFFQKIEEMKNIYFRNKQIKLITVVDQSNSLYKISEKQTRLQKYSYWRIFRDKSYGFFMISSKNNGHDDQNNYDPVRGIAEGVRIAISNMDNHISPEARLSYTVECMIFEIQKLGIVKRKAAQFVRDFGKIPLASHLAIRVAVNNCVSELKNLLTNEKPLQSDKETIIKKLRDLLDKNQDIQKMSSNLKDLSTTKQFIQTQRYKVVYAVKMLGHLSNFTSKSTSDDKIACNLQIYPAYDKKDQKIAIYKSITIASRNLSEDLFDKGLINQSLALSDINFFFLGYRAYPNISKAEKRFFISLEKNKLQQLKLYMYSDNTIGVLNLITNYPDLARQFTKRISGGFFENLICCIFQQHKRRQTNSTMNIFLSLNKSFRFDLNTIFPTKIRLDKIPHFKVKQTYNSLVYHMTKKESGFYMRADDDNPVYDFILSSFTKKELNIFLVDMTFHFDAMLNTKAQNFYNLLNKNVPFQTLIQKCSNTQEAQVSTINIHYVILQAPFWYYKTSDNNEKLEQISKKFQITLLQTEKNREVQILKLKKKLKKVKDIKVSRAHYSQEFQIIVMDIFGNPSSKFNPIPFFTLKKLYG